ncbi:MAG: hypothetical protein IPK60_05100 [Sandaracinaceae bacterium]|nr:hypothetical protein [Sandaracinaceae bacterium]
MRIQHSLILSLLFLTIAACSDTMPTPGADAGGADSSASADMSASVDAADASTVADANLLDVGGNDAELDGAITFEDGGADDAFVDGGLIPCMDSCGNGDCETRARLRAACLPGEAPMSECTRYVADFSCHDAGF